MSIHINAKENQIAETVLLPGDPLRAKYIAETYLEDVICYNTVRGMLGYTGTYKGKKISVQGTGMGIPSISIYVFELLNSYNCKKLIRVGSCGSINKKVKVRDIILASGASTNSSINNLIFNNCNFAPIADFELLSSAYSTAKELGINVHVGNILSTDAFYNTREEFWKPWTDYGVLALEMEASALYTLCARHNAKGLAILTVSDSILTGESTSSEEREKTFTDMMEIALQL
ncbi:purine-nucleoside phosphorylase [Helicovermis profundi]|uniref:Purine nucleoside phosphorylase DeoD-type n=1 Tax=Helicovermis profundi TaxID=3065157 RepID=A0AAU9E2V9_9FIRM|nr:purine-nucleoside phosphorylase [Clostridia bacterium S502]